MKRAHRKAPWLLLGLLGWALGASAAEVTVQQVDSLGNTLAEAAYVSTDEVFTSVSAPTQAGYRFAYWTISPDLATFANRDEWGRALDAVSFIPKDSVTTLTAVYLPELYEAETQVAQRLRAMADAAPEEPDGLDEALRLMKKDHTLAQAYEQIGRMQQAGLIFCAHMMTGIAGKGRGLENGQATAEFFNRTKPERVINFSIFHHRRAPLYRDIEAGR